MVTTELDDVAGFQLEFIRIQGEFNSTSDEMEDDIRTRMSMWGNPLVCLELEPHGPRTRTLENLGMWLGFELRE